MCQICKKLENSVIEHEERRLLVVQRTSKAHDIGYLDYWYPISFGISLSAFYPATARIYSCSYPNLGKTDT